MKYFAAQLIYKLATALRQPQPYLIELRMVSAGEEYSALMEARRIGENMAGHPAGRNRIFLGVKSIEELNLTHPVLQFGETREYLVPDPLA